MGRDRKLRVSSSVEGLRELQTTHFPKLFRAKPWSKLKGVLGSSDGFISKRTYSNNPNSIAC